MKKLAFVLLVAAACGKSADKAPPADPPPTGSGSAVAATEEPSAPAGSGSDTNTGSGSADDEVVADIDVATPMDYEDLANEEITDKTVEARLKALETELTLAN